MNSGIKPFLIAREATIREAMKQLESTSQKVLFVVENASQFVGSLTDGDIRRWLLAEGGLGDAVEKMCNKAPFCVGVEYDMEEIKKAMLARNIGCVPVVNERKEIVELLFWEKVFQNGQKRRPFRPIDLPVAIMAGGQGTRLGAFTRILPKPLIPIGEKTVIELIIDTFLNYGAREFYISVNYKSKIIKSYFEELDPAYSIEFIWEEKPLGTAGSLRYLADKINRPLLVTNCDTIISADLAELVDFHEKNHHDVTLVASLKSFNIPYGVCELANGGTLSRITEKPEFSFLVNTGMYVLQPQKLRLIPGDENFSTIQLIERVKETGGKVGVFPISEKEWIDTGEWAEYRKALSQLTLS